MMRTGGRGVGLIHLVAGMFVTGLVLSLCVPLFLAAERYSEAGRARARMAEQGRRITGHLREDVRQSVSAQVLNRGAALRLNLGRTLSGKPDQVLYEVTPEGLVRSLRPGTPDRQAQQDLFGAPLAVARFERSGKTIRAQLFFEQRLNGRTLPFSTDCAAIPRAEL